MRIAGKPYRAVDWDVSTGSIQWIDQRYLPFHLHQKNSRNPEDVARAIERMEVRGAPTIGAAAAFGLALAWRLEPDRFFDFWVSRFRATRPTAVNLFHACDTMANLAASNPTAGQMMEKARAYADAEVEANRRMGEHLAELLAVGQRRILTHCNAGWLAAVDWGTALSGIYQLAHAGERPFVWVDETRPRLQGARLTAWELRQEEIDCKVQADGAAAWMLAQGAVDAIVVGADRIAKNGDIANKIGTYAISLAAREHGVPMYVAAPSSTLDRQCASGSEIVIEERQEEEVLCLETVNEAGELVSQRIAAPDVGANNPAFDITPWSNISAIVTEEGIWEPE